MSKNLCLNLLSGDSFLQINTSLLHYFNGDFDSLFMISFLLSQYKYLSALDQIDKDEYFYSTVEFIEKRCHLSEYRQREAIKRLENDGLIKTKKKGLPAKRYIYLDFDRIITLISKEEPAIVRDVKTFYNNLNDTIEIGWDKYKASIDRIDRITALAIYFWSKLYKKKFNRIWIWDTEQFGIFNSWIQMRKKTGEIDFNLIKDFLEIRLTMSESEYTNAIILKKFRTWVKGQLPVSPTLRLTDAIQILELTKEI